MNWTDEELNEGERVLVQPVEPPKGSSHRRETVHALMTRAVEIASARGGTMTADEHTWRCAKVALTTPEVADEFARHNAAQGARVAALESRCKAFRRKVAVLEAGEKAWRQRVEKAAEALADVAPGELGRLDLVGRIERLKADNRDADAKWMRVVEDRDRLAGDLARLKPSGQVAEDEALVRRHLEGVIGKPGPRNAFVYIALSRLAARAQEREEVRRLLGANDIDALPVVVILERQRSLSEAEALRAKVAGLEQEVRQWMGQAKTNGTERDAARAEVERLKVEMGEVRTRLMNAENARDGAESHLAAIQERGTNEPLLLRKANQMTYWALIQWVLEGDAPQDTSTGGDYGGEIREEHEDAPQEAKDLLAELSRQPGTDAEEASYRNAMSAPPDDNICEHGDHPAPAGQRFCSGACQRCEATEPSGDECAGLCGGETPQEAKCTCHMLQRDTQWHDTDCPRSPVYKGRPHAKDGARPTAYAPPCVCGFLPAVCEAARHPCSPTCTHDDAATSGHPQRVKEGSEAWKAMHPNGSCTCAGEGTCAWCDSASTDASYERGAEAMRAVCLEAIQEELAAAIEGVVAAIEGVVP